MHPDQPTGVAPVRAGLRAEARRVRGVGQREVVDGQGLAGVQVGQRHLGGRDEEQLAVRDAGLEQVLLELRQLPRAGHRLPVDQRGHRELGVAVLARRGRGSSGPAPAPASRPRRAAPRTAGPTASSRAAGRGCRASRRGRRGRAGVKSNAGGSPQLRTSAASSSLLPSGMSSAGRFGMPSSRSCSCASSSRASVSASATTVFSSRARSTSAGRSSGDAERTAVAVRLDSARASSPRWIAALRAASSFSRDGDVQRVAAPGEPPHGVGGGVEQDARVVHLSRLSPGRERVSGAVVVVAAVREQRQDVRCATPRRREEPPCPPPSRPTPPAPPTSRCSATRSATTSTAPPPGAPTARRSSRSRPGAAGPTPSSWPRSTRVALGLLDAGRRHRRPGRDLGAERRRVGARPVRHGEDRRDPGQHQPGLPHPRAGVRAQPVRRRGAGRRAQLQDRPTTRR